MMPRAIWSGAVSFGLVNVPVKVFSATAPKDLRFHQLHEKDGARIRMKRFCSAEDKEVPYDEIAKGFEVAPDQYVMVTPEDLEAFDPEATRSIDILDFVELADIDPLYFESSYYLVPDKGADKAYALLLDAMRDSGKVAIARMVMRTKEYLAAIRPTEEALALSTMLFEDEVVSPKRIEGLPERKAKVTERELQLARQLIDSLSTTFDPGKYKDEHRARVLEFLESKARGEAVIAAPAPEKSTRAVDLMAALEASLAHKERQGQAAKGGRGEAVEAVPTGAGPKKGGKRGRRGG